MSNQMLSHPSHIWIRRAMDSNAVTIWAFGLGLMVVAIALPALV